MVMRAEGLLAEHKIAIDAEVDRFVTLYYQQHLYRDDSTLRSFINNQKLDCQRSIANITIEFLQKAIIENIDNKADFLERIMIQDRQGMISFIEKLSA